MRPPSRREIGTTFTGKIENKRPNKNKKHHRREGFTESVPEGNKQTLLEGGMKKTADVANDPSYTRPPV